MAMKILKAVVKNGTVIIDVHLDASKEAEGENVAHFEFGTDKISDTETAPQVRQRILREIRALCLERVAGQNEAPITGINPGDDL